MYDSPKTGTTRKKIVLVVRNEHILTDWMKFNRDALLAHDVYLFGLDSQFLHGFGILAQNIHPDALHGGHLQSDGNRIDLVLVFNDQESAKSPEEAQFIDWATHSNTPVSYNRVSADFLMAMR